MLSNLGGHDLEELFAVLSQAEAEPERPTIIFAYTIKGWGTPIAGHPLNHSMLLSEEQIADLRERLGVSGSDEWARLDPGSPPGRLCLEVADRLFPPNPTPPVTLSADDVPMSLSLPTQGALSTQQSLGRLLMRLARVPQLADRIVTTSPDVSVSTNLSGWIIKTGVFAPEELPDYESEANQLRSWQHGPWGQHIELGISEMNLFTLLGMLACQPNYAANMSSRLVLSTIRLCAAALKPHLCPIFRGEVYFCRDTIRYHAVAGGGCPPIHRYVLTRCGNPTTGCL